MIAKSFVSHWVHTYVFYIGPKGPVGPTEVRRAVVPTLLETPCHLHQRFTAVSDCVMVSECVVVYEIDTERLVDEAGIRGLGKDEKPMEK